MKFSNTQKIIYTGMLTALQIILSRFLGIQTPIVHISFSFLPLVITAILFGSGASTTSAAISDFIGATLFPKGAYFPGFTLSSALCGLTYGILLHNKPKKLWRVVLSVLITAFINITLSTYWLYLITNKGLYALLPARLLQQAIMIPVKIITIWFLVYRITEMINKHTRKSSVN